MITVYGIVYWTENGNRLNFLQNKDGSVMAFSRIEEADAKAYEIEEKTGEDTARVISLESVAE